MLHYCVPVLLIAALISACFVIDSIISLDKLAVSMASHMSRRAMTSVVILVLCFSSAIVLVYKEGEKKLAEGRIQGFIEMAGKMRVEPLSDANAKAFDKARSEFSINNQGLLDATLSRYVLDQGIVVIATRLPKNYTSDKFEVIDAGDRTVVLPR